MIIVLIFGAIVSSLATITVVRSDCIKEKKCEIVVKEIGISIEKSSDLGSK